MKLMPPTDFERVLFLEFFADQNRIDLRATLKEHDHRDEDPAVRRNVKIFRTQLFDRLADQAVVEQDARRGLRARLQRCLGSARSKGWSRMRSGVAIGYQYAKYRRTHLSYSTCNVYNCAKNALQVLKLQLIYQMNIDRKHRFYSALSLHRSRVSRAPLPAPASGDRRSLHLRRTLCTLRLDRDFAMQSDRNGVLT